MSFSADFWIYNSIPCLVFVVFGRGAFPGLLILPLQVESCLKLSAVHLLCFWHLQFMSQEYISDGRLAKGRGWKGAKDTGVPKDFCDSERRRYC